MIKKLCWKQDKLLSAWFQPKKKGDQEANVTDLLQQNEKNKKKGDQKKLGLQIY